MLQPLPSLKETTLKLMAESGLNDNQLATRAELGYFWIRKLRRGIITNPGAERLEKLNKFLTALKDAQ